MKIECIKEKLETAVRIADRATGKNLSLPILSSILLDSSKNSLFIKSTNLDLGLEVEIPIKGEFSKPIAVPSSVLWNFLSNLGQERVVNLEVVGDVLEITCGLARASVKTQTVDDFPTIPKIADGKNVSVPANVLVSGFKSVCYSAASNSMKPELSSVYIHTKDEHLIFAATDSFRLAEKRIKIKSLKSFPSVMIPAKNASEIIKIFEAHNEDVDIWVGKNQISFSCGFIYLVSRVIDGVFPDYEQIIPKDFSTTAVVIKQDFAQAMKIITVFSDAFNQVNLNIIPNKKIFEIKAKNSTLGDASSKISPTAKGESIDIGFNHRYLADCLQPADSDSLVFGFSGQHKPLVIRTVGGDQGFTYLVMPLNK